MQRSSAFWSSRSPLLEQTRRGFTLIELLIVLAVVGILAAMLFPAFNRARSMADSTVCRGNLHQITLGIAMYAQ